MMNGDCGLEQVVVVGMHRSGTSLTASILHHLGISMGDDLLGAAPSNPHGHYEDLRFLELNIDILEQAGGNWKRPPSIPDIRKASDKLRTRIQATVDSRRTDAKWGFKDPRTSLTLPAYWPFLTGPIVVVCKRDPEDIAESLKRRDGLSREAGVILARTYYNYVEQHLLNLDAAHICCSFRAWFEEPETQLEHLSDALSVSVSEEEREDVLGLIEPRKRSLLDRIRRFVGGL